MAKFPAHWSVHFCSSVDGWNQFYMYGNSLISLKMWISLYRRIPAVNCTTVIDTRSIVIHVFKLCYLSTFLTFLNLFYFLSSVFYTSVLWYLASFTTFMVPMMFVAKFDITFFLTVPVLWRCWLGGRKGIRPVKNWVVGCWRGYLPGARCRFAYGPADTTATHCLLLQ